MILSLGMVAPVMLLDFDAPIAADELQQSVWIGLLGLKATDAVARFLGGLGNPPSPQMIHRLVEAEDLGRSGQTDRGAIDDLAPELTFLDSSVAFIGGVSLRGEYRRVRAVWLWRKPEAGYP